MWYNGLETVYRSLSENVQPIIMVVSKKSNIISPTRFARGKTHGGTYENFSC